MKKYIDYLFWKRTWFRICFIFIPLWMIPAAYVFGFGQYGSPTRDIYCVVYIALLMLGIVDNNNVDNPKNPFKK